MHTTPQAVVYVFLVIVRSGLTRLEILTYYHGKQKATEHAGVSSSFISITAIFLRLWGCQALGY